jgi:nucleotide-binding universal stress UspA family protein
MACLDILAAPLRRASSRVRVVLVEGDPAAEIGLFLEREGIDLAVMGRHTRHGIDRWIAGSVTAAVAREARCSVLGVPLAAAEPGATALAPVIVCAVDLTPSSEETLARAARIALRRRARLVLLHVIDPWTWNDPLPMARGNEKEVRYRLAQSAHERLSELVTKQAPTASGLETVVVFGRPQDEIVDLARERGAELLVVGAHSQGRLERFLFGSTAERVLAHGPCSVLLMRPAAARRSDRREEETFVHA